MSQTKPTEVKKPLPPAQPSALARLVRACPPGAVARDSCLGPWRRRLCVVAQRGARCLAPRTISPDGGSARRHAAARVAAHSGCRREVFRDGGFANNVWLHDPALAEQIAKTFELHPWVAKVERVTLRGATVNIDLTYRRAVCMVEVPGGVFPVDIEGTLLPRDDFTPAEARRYPRLAGVTSVPAGLAPMPWGDLHVVGGRRSRRRWPTAGTNCTWIISASCRPVRPTSSLNWRCVLARRTRMTRSSGGTLPVRTSPRNR